MSTAIQRQNISHVSHEILSRTRRPDDRNMRVIFKDAPLRPWNVSTDGDMDDCVYNEILIPSDFYQYIRVATLLRHFYGTETHNMFGMHNAIDGITINDAFNFAVFKEYDYVFNPSFETVQNIAGILHSLYHRANMIHGNVCPILLGTLKDPPNTPIVRPCGSMMSVKHLMSRKQSINVSLSLIPSPIQVIIDMLSSKLEKDEIEYVEFKTKFVRYWDHLLPQGLKHQIPQWVFKAFSAVAGCVDYLDHILNRYCIIFQSPTNGKTYVRKDPSKALGYLQDIDLFALCISVFMMQRPINQMPPQNILEYLGTLIKGDEVPLPPVPPEEEEPAPAAKETKKVVEEPPHAAVLPIKSASPPPAPDATEEDKEKKVSYKGQMRVVRADAKGEYILWQKQKLYLPFPSP